MKPSLFLRLALLVPALSPLALSAQEVTPHAGMLRFPDVSSDSIVFVYANDLWTVPRAGGTATPLASPPGMELMPRFSADGTTIAFSGNYEGNRDLYTIPATGGRPQRVTHHPSGELLCDWTPDGSLLFQGNGLAGLPRQPQLFTVSAAGGMPERVPVPYGTSGTVSPDGQWLAYTPFGRDFRTWKRYMGGHATDIWLFNLSDHRSHKVTEWEGTDTLPMWYGPLLYYLSDAGEGHRLNVWVYDPRSGGRRQITRFADYDVKWPSVGPGASGGGEIVFQLGGELRLLDLDSERSWVVPVTIPGDSRVVHEKTIDASKYIDDWAASSTGKRAVVEARGDIWTLPAENGVPRNLTQTDDVAERSPAWSPDGQWIAYFSDATGEYQLYVTQSDGKGETRQLTKTLAVFPFAPTWSHGSDKIAFTDKAGRLHLTEVESGDTRVLVKNPVGQPLPAAWSHDGRWLAYARPSEESLTSSVWLYDLENDTEHQVTSGMFNDGSPVFDRKGDHLYFSSSRNFSPTYSEIDSTFVYLATQSLYAVPLRSDVERPWALESDEETWKDEEAPEADAESEEGEGEGGVEEAAPEAKEEASEQEPDDGLSGVWEGTVTGPDPIPPGGMPVTLTIELYGTVVEGVLSSPMVSVEIEDGTWDPATKTLRFVIQIPDTDGGYAELQVSGSSMTGKVVVMGQDYPVTATRTSGGGGQEAVAEGEDKKPEKAAEKVEIEIDGFEARAIKLPVPRGSFGRLAVNDKNQLIYNRRSVPGFSEGSGIKLFDIDDDKKTEKSVASGGGGFDISGDGKKLLIVRGDSGSIQNAAAGASGKNVVTRGMMVKIDPRDEWRQMFVEAWRLQRDYFYDPNMHGVDWPGMRERYMPMVEDCATREDLDYVLGELIAEINVGHAYVSGGGDTESSPDVPVGMLGCDYELHDGAYRITRIHQGGPWNAEVRGPLIGAGVDVNEGDYLLAVDGEPVDTAKDPWAAFLGKAGRTTQLTVSTKPEIDDEAREVLVKPAGGETDLRYHSWIEHNRAYVAEKTGGRVGYIYVPDTGQRGQNDLFEQFYGQAHKDALIIDERWNGGGQIPSRFVELLDRPVMNYWATRDGRDLPWPPDSHQGPKCMLINGAAGSGGDLFPEYFKMKGIGKLIGRRTWGGLVGISGNPSLIDGGGVTVPTFAFYETDGTWGIEGHGVEPDIEVMDDPALMADGGDPQLDAAIQHMLEELERRPYRPPGRPSYPDRAGMGVTEADK